MLFFIWIFIYVILRTQGANIVTIYYVILAYYIFFCDGKAEFYSSPQCDMILLKSF